MRGHICFIDDTYCRDCGAPARLTRRGRIVAALALALVCVAPVPLAVIIFH